MIITELFLTRYDGVKLYRTYSDEGRYIIQNETEAVYEEAVDVEGAGYTYREGEPIPASDEDDYAQVGRIMMGVEM